jgi:hypothetical protein
VKAPREKQKLASLLPNKPANHKTARDNQFYFRGFYDRLKSLDVK